MCYLNKHLYEGECSCELTSFNWILIEFIIFSFHTRTMCLFVFYSQGYLHISFSQGLWKSANYVSQCPHLYDNWYRGWCYWSGENEWLHRSCLSSSTAIKSKDHLFFEAMKICNVQHKKLSSIQVCLLWRSLWFIVSTRHSTESVMSRIASLWIYDIIKILWERSYNFYCNK